MKACDLEGFAAADVCARELVIATDHIGLCLGKLGPVALVGVAGKLVAFAAHNPGDLVVTGLSALGTGESVGSCFGRFVEEIALFHESDTPQIEEAPLSEKPQQSLMN